MNNISTPPLTPFAKFIKITTMTLLILTVLLAAGTYVYYKTVILGKTEYVDSGSSIDELNEEDSIAQTLQSMSQVEEEDQLTEDETSKILDNNQSEEEALTEEDYAIILKNNSNLEE